MNPQISSRTGLLDIPGADETLEGEYTCRAENGVEPSIMKTIRIDVKSKDNYTDCKDNVNDMITIS